MTLTDYVSAAIIDFLNRRLGSNKTTQTMFTWEIFRSFVEERTDLIEISPDIFSDSIDNLKRMFLINIVTTPHAAPRYLVQKLHYAPFVERLDEHSPSIFQVRTLQRALGWDWLAESIDGASMAEDSQTGPTEEPVWSPLPVERPDVELDTAIQNLESLAELVRSDNGYASAHTAERTEVLSRLDAARGYLRHASQVTASAVQAFIVWPLERLASRFEPKTAVGIAAALFWETIKGWVKKKGGEFLDRLF